MFWLDLWKGTFMGKNPEGEKKVGPSSQIQAKKGREKQDFVCLRLLRHRFSSYPGLCSQTGWDLLSGTCCSSFSYRESFTHSLIPWLFFYYYWMLYVCQAAFQTPNMDKWMQIKPQVHSHKIKAMMLMMRRQQPAVQRTHAWGPCTKCAHWKILSCVEPDWRVQWGLLCSSLRLLVVTSLSSPWSSSGSQTAWVVRQGWEGLQNIEFWFTFRMNVFL